MERASVGFSDDAYENPFEWEELKKIEAETGTT